MHFEYPANNAKHTLKLGIHTASPQRIVIQAYDKNKPHTYYINRGGEVNGYREFELRFPKSPSLIGIDVFNPAVGKFQGTEDTSFALGKYKFDELKTRPIWLSKNDRVFLNFAEKFSENAGILSATTPTDKYSTYRSANNKFTIDYYDELISKDTGQPVNTPARVNHATGIIEVSKKHFLRYSVSVRMVILLHEYSHKYKNPKNNLPIDHEIGADIAALMMYMSRGWSAMEAQSAFLNVFNDANSPENHKRYLIINDFITKYERGEWSDFSDYNLK